MDVCPKEDDKVVGLGRVESLPIGLGREPLLGVKEGRTPHRGAPRQVRRLSVESMTMKGHTIGTRENAAGNAEPAQRLTRTGAL